MSIDDNERTNSSQSSSSSSSSSKRRSSIRSRLSGADNMVGAAGNAPGDSRASFSIADVLRREENFASELERQLDEELKILEATPHTSDDTFAIYGDAFDRVIDHATHTKRVLSLVKREYDRCVASLKSAHRESAFLTGHLKAKAAEPATARNYRARITDLEENIRSIREDNVRILEELKELRDRRGKEHQRLRLERETANSSQEFTDTDLAPGLSLEEATDLKNLKKKSQELASTLSHLRELRRSSFQPRENKERTKAALLTKMAAIDEAKAGILETRRRRSKVKLAVEAAEAFISAPPIGVTIGEYVIGALKGARKSSAPPKFVSLDQMDLIGDFAGDREGSAAQIHDEKEAEALMEYMQQFTLLFDSQKYAEAATCAANSPKGILRNFETLTRFKEASKKAAEEASTTGSGRSTTVKSAKSVKSSAKTTDLGTSSPMLLFCQSLLVAVGLEGGRLDSRMSLECVKVALDEGRLELATHWIAKGKLHLSTELGEVLLNHAMSEEFSSWTTMLEVVALAQHVFQSVENHRMTAECLMMQGLTRAFVSHCRVHGAAFVAADYIRFFVASVDISVRLASLTSASSSTSSQRRRMLVDAGYVLTTPDAGLRPNSAVALALGRVVGVALDAELKEVVLRLMRKIDNWSGTTTTTTTTTIESLIKSDDSDVDWSLVAKLVRDFGYPDLAEKIDASIGGVGGVEDGGAEFLPSNEEDPDS